MSDKKHKNVQLKEAEGEEEKVITFSLLNKKFKREKEESLKDEKKNLKIY